MTTIDNLAQRVAQTYSIDIAAARTVVTTFIDQIADDPDLWDADTQTLSTEGAEVVTTAINESYANDPNGW